MVSGFEPLSLVRVAGRLPNGLDVRLAEVTARQPEGRVTCQASMHAAGLSCPRCRLEFSKVPDSGWVECFACHARYPVIGSIPILVPHPGDYLCRSLLALSNARTRILSALSEVESIATSEPFAPRRERMRRVARALRANLALVDRQRALLLAHTRPLARSVCRARQLEERILARVARRFGRRLRTSLPEVPSTGWGFADALVYLRTDWGRTAEGERQVATINEAVTESIQTCCDPSGRAVYLGAGLGRHAFDAGRLFSSVLAVELSFAAAALLSAVQDGPVPFSTVSWHGANTDQESVELREAVFPPPPYAANARYVVGDALSLPVADASMEAVVSIFFTDIVSASRLLPEVRRVLRPGGRFISLGPPSCRLVDDGEELTKDEMKHVIETVHGLGFEAGDRMFELPYRESGGSYREIFRVWSFVATRRR